MRTIGRRHTRKTPGDHLSQCSECRAPDVRSKLIRLADGQLYHRKGDCRPSKLAIELLRGNAEKATQRRVYPPIDGGNR